MITEEEEKTFSMRCYKKKAENESRSYCEIANASSTRMKYRNNFFFFFQVA